MTLMNLWAHFRIQLANYIIDVPEIDKRFSKLNGLCDLSRRFVQAEKHLCYSLVFRLVNLLLSVTATSVERAFPAMNFIKNELQSRVNDDFLSGCMVLFLEKYLLNDAVSTNDIILSFQVMKPRRVDCLSEVSLVLCRISVRFSELLIIWCWNVIDLNREE